MDLRGISRNISENMQRCVGRYETARKLRSRWRCKVARRSLCGYCLKIREALHKACGVSLGKVESCAVHITISLPDTTGCNHLAGITGTEAANPQDDNLQEPGKEIAVDTQNQMQMLGNLLSENCQRQSGDYQAERANGTEHGRTAAAV